MTRDFTDFWIVVRRSDEPIHKYWHIVNTPGKGLQATTFSYHGYRYAINRARLTQLKGWRPWRLWNHFQYRKIPTYVKEWSRSKRIGMLVYQEPANGHTEPDLMTLGHDIVVPIRDLGPPIQPIHVSKPISVPDPDKEKVTARTSPRVLASIVEANHYRLSWRSIKFGVGRTLRARWLLIVVAAIIGVVLLLYFTGNIPI